MTAHPFPPPPGPSGHTHGLADLQSARADMVDTAWHVILDKDVDDDTLRAACKTVLQHCRDPRRDTAADLLAIIGHKDGADGCK